MTAESKVPLSIGLAPDPDSTCHCPPETRSWVGVAPVHFCVDPDEEKKENIKVGCLWVGKVFCEICGLWAPQVTDGDQVGCCGVETAGWSLRQIHKHKAKRDMTGVDGEGI